MRRVCLLDWSKGNLARSRRLGGPLQCQGGGCGVSEDQPVLTLTYQHGIKLNSIQEPGGPFMFKQLCTTKVDSIISSGNVIFKKSKIGKIKNCDFQWQIREDTLRAIIIETFREKNI